MTKENIIKKIKETKFNSPGSGHGKLYQDIAFVELREGLPKPKRIGSEKRLIKILDNIQNIKNKTILDIGCNLGYFTFKLNEAGATCIGVDRDLESIEIADKIKDYKKLNNIEFINSELNQSLISYINSKYNKIDIILLLSVNHWLISSINSRSKLDYLLRSFVSNNQTIFYEPSFANGNGVYYPETTNKNYVINFLKNLGYNKIELISTGYASNAKKKRKLWKGELDIKNMVMECIGKMKSVSKISKANSPGNFLFHKEKGRAVGYYNNYFIKIVKKKHERFFSYQNEADLLKQLRGINFVPYFYFSADTEKFRLYFYSKISGKPLNKFIKQRYPDVFIDLEEKLITILKKLKNIGILYRDLRPDNVLYDSTTNEVHIIDFQWARLEIKEMECPTDQDKRTLEIALNKIKKNGKLIIGSNFTHEFNTTIAKNIIQDIKKQNKNILKIKIIKIIKNSILIIKKTTNDKK